MKTKIILLLIVISSCSFSNSSDKSAAIKLGKIDVSSDNSSIVFSVLRDDRSEVYVSTINGDSVKLLSKTESGVFHDFPKFSPEGSKILLIEFSKNKSRIGFVDMANYNIEYITKGEDLITEALFLTENIIVFCRAKETSKSSNIGVNSPKNSDIYIFDIVTKKEKRITELNAYSILYLNKFNNGKNILFNLDNEKICYVNIESKEIEILNFKNPLPLFVGKVAISPQGNLIVFADSYNIYLSDMENLEIKKLIGPNNFQISNLIFNNKNEIIFTKNIKGDFSFFSCFINSIECKEKKLEINL